MKDVCVVCKDCTFFAMGPHLDRIFDVCPVCEGEISVNFDRWAQLAT